MAVTFNGTTVNITPVGGTVFALELTSVSLGGGDVTMVDVTNAGHTRRKQVAGMPEPLSLTLEGHSPHYLSLPSAGQKCDITFSGIGIATENPIPFTFEDFVFQAGEISGDIDSTYTISLTFIEGDDATVTENPVAP